MAAGAAPTGRVLASVVATSYLLGVSTRRMEKLVETLGVTRLSRSQVSEMAKDLDGQVEAFRSRPVGCRARHLPRRRRTCAQSTRERSDGERARPARDRGKR